MRRVGRVDESFPLNVQPQTRGRHLVDAARRVDARNRKYLVRRVEQVVEANDRQEVTQLQQQRSYRGQEVVEVNDRQEVTQLQQQRSYRGQEVVEANDRQEVTQLQQQRSYRGQEAVEVNER